MATKVRRQDKQETPSERFEKAVAKVFARQQRAKEREERRQREAESGQEVIRTS